MSTGWIWKLKFGQTTHSSRRIYFTDGLHSVIQQIPQIDHVQKQVLQISCLSRLNECTLVQALRLCTGRTAHRGSRGITTLSWPRHSKGVRGQRHAPAALYPRERPGTHCTGGWVGPRTGLDRCGKSRPPLGFDPRTVQPVASRYTDWTTRTTQTKEVIHNKTKPLKFLGSFCTRTGSRP